MRSGNLQEGVANLSAIAKSVGVHLLFVAVLVFGLSHSNAREIRRPQVINATIVDLSQLQASQDQAKQAQQQKLREEAAERRREQQRRVAAEREQQQDAERERQRLAKLSQEEAERAKQQREQRERADELRRKREQIAEQRKNLAAEDAARRAAEEESLMQQMLAQEEQSRAAEADAQARLTKRQQWEGMVRQLVQQNWRKPPTTAEDMVCVLNIRLVPGGDVTDVSLANCRIDTSTRRSIEDAVMRSSPLPWSGFEDVAPRAFGFRFCAQETVCES